MNLIDRLNELANLAEQRMAADNSGYPTEVFDAELKTKLVGALDHNALLFDKILQTLQTNIQDNKK